MSKLTREQVIKLANLSKLRLSDEEIVKYQNELSNILSYIERLNEVDDAGLEPTYQITGLQNVMREDVVVKQQATPEELMKLLPKSKDGYIQVGRMI
ncbi:MAG: Asp-tRNA(Asn)/Glu-tRNA(Gln) amidotransferase subunit GatC [Candidatus Saccharibacteria bacterium]|nr:Asp-tRNA(Asn)/Glu-tRNA(Gln) amidotransferase subunit GatC [Candidatus Saccharibacteria bacterium]